MAVATIVLAAAFTVAGILIWLIIGLLAGFIASMVMRTSSYGIIGDMIIGLIGAFISGLLVNLLIPSATFGFIGSTIVAIFGACLLLSLLRLGHRKEPSNKRIIRREEYRNQSVFQEHSHTADTEVSDNKIGEL